MAESLEMVFEGSLVLKIRTTSATPKLATILLMGSPITLDSKCLFTLSTHEGLCPMLSLVMCL
ncbi:hypothetical protein LguiA_013291 [Lonicera macranthoides]